MISLHSEVWAVKSEAIGFEPTHGASLSGTPHLLWCLPEFPYE